MKDLFEGSRARLRSEGTKYVVACDHQYYSDVAFFDTREEADAAAKDWARDDGGGASYYPHKPRIVVAEVLSTITLKEPEKK